MKIERFQAFVEEIQNDASLSSLTTGLKTYRFFDGTWFDGDNRPVIDHALIQQLSRSRQKGHWRPKKSPVSYCSIDLLDTVVIATYSAPPKRPRMNQVRDAILKCLQHSNNAFDARHDQLTGVLNKNAIEKQLARALDGLARQASAEPYVANPMGAEEAVLVLALDIDHFKQVNDTYGHLYGDIVLKCFARRVERLLDEVKELGLRDVVLGRSGGEEFTVVCVGELPGDRATRIAEQVRSRVETLPLPSDDEWAEIQKASIGSSVDLPHVTERRVTVSIGTSTQAQKADAATASEFAVRLLREADTALYRAKSGGRNTVRHFADILARHGRILEHHSETGVVAIDIGAAVQVTSGQEFLVFHPQFAGGEPFVHTDGRTRKRIGTYPRRPYGRILAFDVQSEVAFCSVLECPSGAVFPAGSALEAVPVGAISHLLVTDPKFGGLAAPELHAADQLPKVIEAIASGGQQWPLAVVFSIANVADLVAQRGTAFVNHVLATVYKLVRQQFPGDYIVGQLQATDIAVVGAEMGEAEATEKAKAVAAATAASCSGLPRIVAGLSTRPSAAPDNSTLQPGRALEYARYAVAAEGRSDAVVTMFSSATAVRILRAHRQARKFAEALADYRRLRELGVREAVLENTAALCAFDSDPPDYDLAQTALRVAVGLDPAVGMYPANLCVVLFSAGARADAWAMYVQATSVKGFVLPEHYWPVVALSALAVRTDAGPVNDEVLAGIFRKALSVGPKSCPWVDAAEFERAAAGIPGLRDQ